MRSPLIMPACAAGVSSIGDDHLDHAVLHRDFDAEPAEFAAGLHLHVAEMLRIEIGRMRIERGQHAVDRRLDQLGDRRASRHSPSARAPAPRRTDRAGGKSPSWRPTPTGCAPSSPSSIRQRARPTPEAPTARIRISASSLHLFGSLGPPWVRVYWPAVLSEFDIEDGARTVIALARRCRVAHHRDRLSGKDKLAQAYVYAVHPRKQDMIAPACIDDQ